MRRRGALRVALGGVIAGLSGGAAASARRNRVCFITPRGAGARDGADWSNAGTLRDLNAFVAAAGPGGEVRLAADMGPYLDAEDVPLRCGGVRGRPVLIRGAASGGADAAEPAEIVGSRSETFTPNAPKGRECFRLLAGADHLTFSSLAFRNIGNGCIRIGAPVTGLTIEECTFRNVYRFIENARTGGGGDASLTHFAIRRCVGERIERSFLRLRYRSAEGRIEDCRADSQGVEGDAFAVGCALEGEAHDISYLRCTMENFRQNGGDHYWNGDGFSDELGNYRIRYRQCVARGATDGGFDCKSAHVVLEECLAEDNKRNFRIWATGGRLLSCTSRNPNWRGAGHEPGGPAHVSIAGAAGPRIMLADFTAEAQTDAPVFDLHAADARIDVHGHRFDVPAGAPVIADNGQHPGELRLR